MTEFGRFLWVKFQILEICEALNDDAIRGTLDDLPKDLTTTYMRVLRRISESPGGSTKLETAARAFRWLVCAKRPLTIEEPKVAVVLEQNDVAFPTTRIPINGSKVVRACGNLIVLNEADRCVRLAHHTILQFLVVGRDPQTQIPSAGTHSANGPRIESFEYVQFWRDWFFQLSTAEEHIGRICVAFLNFTDFESQIEVIQSDSIAIRAPGEAINGLFRGMIPAFSFFGKRFSYFSDGSLDTNERNGVTLVLPKRRHRNDERSDPIFDKYQLLEYINSYWHLHVHSIWEYDNEFWNLVHRIAFTKKFFFQVHPWDSPDYTNCDPDRFPSLRHTPHPSQTPLFRWSIDTGAGIFWRCLFEELNSTSSGPGNRTKCIDERVLFEMQAGNDDSDIFIGAARGGCLSILEYLINSFVRRNFAIPVKVLYRVLSLSRTARMLKYLTNYVLVSHVKAVTGEPEPDRTRYLWQTKPVEWFGRSWTQDKVVEGRMGISDTLMEEAIRDNNDQFRGWLIKFMESHEICWTPRPNIRVEQ